MNPFSLIPGPYQLLAKGIALLALLLSLWWAWCQFTGHYIDIGRAEVQKTLDDHIADDVAADIKRKAENLAKDTKAQIASNGVMAKHTDEINNIRIKYAKLSDDKKLADSSIASYRDRVRIELAKAAERLPDISGTAEGSASNQSDRDSASLREACEITTQDFNALHEAWDVACAVYGCKEY